MNIQRHCNFSPPARRAFYFVAAFLILTAVQPDALAAYNTIGGDGGRPYTLQCPPNQFAVGMAARFEREGWLRLSFPIIQLRLKCVAVNAANGNWSGTPRWTSYSRTGRWEGTQGLRSNRAICPANEFISPAVYGDTASVGLATVVFNLHWNCVRFSEIDPTRGTSRKRIDSRGWGVGAPTQAMHVGNELQRQLSRDGTDSDHALHVLHLKYGLAVDSVKVGALHLPWTTSPQALQNSPAPLPFGGRASIAQPQPAASQPDLSVAATSTLWRYTGRTLHGRISYRKVSERFCASGMIPRSGGKYFTKSFDLPDITYRVTNSGNAAANGSFNVRHNFGGSVQDQTAPALQPGQRRDFTVTRQARVNRCVTTGNVPGGCHECAGQTPYQDPALVINVDTGNAIRESNENNNELRQ